uniref:Uncharacterized protein n=1 Tax=Anguilla anguilla TaxID=7936 RepID=A0A0E9UG80_ANGAN
MHCLKDRADLYSYSCDSLL